MSRNSFMSFYFQCFEGENCLKQVHSSLHKKCIFNAFACYLFYLCIYEIFELKMYLVCFLSFLFMTFDIFNIIQYLDVYVSARKYTEKYTFMYLLFHILYLEEKQIFFNVYLIDTCLCLDHQKFFFILFFCITKECNN